MVSRRSFIASLGGAGLAAVLGLGSCAQPLPQNSRREQRGKTIEPDFLLADEIRDTGWYDLGQASGVTTWGEAVSGLAVLGLNGNAMPFGTGRDQFYVYVRRNGVLYYPEKPIDQTWIYADDRVEVVQVEYDDSQVPK